MTTCTATYSPDDNKLRLYASSRLDSLTYQRVRDAGFIWAPKQELFVAPSWTPAREDLLIELAGEIDDEDKGLVERAEERAERFDNYSEARGRDADHAHAAVHALADHIPFGQPILVGHHSERRARKDAQRIHDGMRRAVDMWKTSTYWADRATGAIRNAVHKERVDVRARRIKGIEADLRKSEKVTAESQKFLAAWLKDGLTMDRAKFLANYSHVSRCFTLAEYPREEPISQYEGSMGIWSALDHGIISPEQARDLAVKAFAGTVERNARWIEHYQNRLSYERAMLGEQGGLVAENVDIAVGGRALIRGEWLTVLRLNRSAGKLVSVTTNAKYVRVRGIEEIEQYEAPSADTAAAVASAVKKPAICNYPGEGFLPITQKQWDDAPKDYKGTKNIAANAEHGAHRGRVMMGVYAGETSNDFNKRHAYPFVFITDAKRKDPPAVPTAAPSAPAIPAPEVVLRPARSVEPTEPNKFELLAGQLKAGVQVVTAPQLFPTPPELAARMVDEAAIESGSRVLEPEAGTARILHALRALCVKQAITNTEVVAIEVNSLLADALERSNLASTVKHADFLHCGAELGLFDQILMNPPFSRGQDIAHILHAVPMLKPQGQLTAICANGPKQQETLLPLVRKHGGTWEILPRGVFKSSGTDVAAVLLRFRV